MDTLPQVKKRFPKPNDVRVKYLKIDDFTNIDEYIDRTVVVLFKYHNLVYGKSETDFLYCGKMVKPKDSINDKLIWIKDFRLETLKFMTKSRFTKNNSSLELHVEKIEEI